VVRRPTRREAGIAVACAIIFAILLLWIPGCGPTARSAEAAGRGSIGARSSFTISGDVSRPISLGELVALDLTLTNSNDVDLAIDRITVTAVRVDAPSADADHPCGAADFEVRHLSGGGVLMLAANTAHSLSELNLARENWPAVGMLNRPVNQDGCKGASLTLGYEASGVEVSR
jgi:hypothetical protein